MLGLILFASTSLAEPPAAPTYQELMDPAMFPEAQRGMTVGSITRQRDSLISIPTTGADVNMHPDVGVVRFCQRVGRRREVVRLRAGDRWVGATITHEGAGFARITFERPRMTVRVNGDSLFMLHVHEPLEVSIERRIDPGWHASYNAHHLIADEWGAFGLYCSDDTLDDGFDPYEETVATYALPADAVLWVGVCPPKPYDWQRSFTDNVVWHWSNQLAYPPNDALRSWRPHGNIVLLQSELLLWEDWNLDFVPRLGLKEFARVRETIHNLGMRFIVYTSPYYFLKGTDLEEKAIHTFEDFTGWPPGTATGENMDLFMDAITRVMNDYRPDGLYMDGQYTGNPAALYALARGTRELIGEDGILEWHSTGALGAGDCYLPQADAYVDFILRGEGRTGRYDDDDYLRFFVSGYNIHNSIGVLRNNSAEGYPTKELTDRLLSVNGRYHTIAGWPHNPDIMRVIDEQYRPRLDERLRRQVNAGCDRRQQQVAAKTEAARAEREALKRPPDWDEPVLALDFDTMPEAEEFVSEENDDPFSIAGGALSIEGKAHTHAYLRLPLNARASGFEVRLRLGSDGGMSWGPGVLVETTGGSKVRLGLRSDGLIQSDILGLQRVGDSHETGQRDKWIWLRARWLQTVGVVEKSADGEHWERVQTFEHGGALLEPAAALLVGKVPYNGEATDHSEPGEEGESQIGEVRVY